MGLADLQIHTIHSFDGTSAVRFPFSEKILLRSDVATPQNHVTPISGDKV